MIDFERMFKAKRDSVDTVSGKRGNKKTVFSIRVTDDWLTIEKIKGRDMYFEEIRTAFGLFLQEYELEHFISVYRPERNSRYRFYRKTGDNGQVNYYVESDRYRNGYPEREWLFGITRFGKCGHITCSLGDFADLLIADNFLELTTDKSYYYDASRDQGSSADITIIAPRNIKEEDGWTGPDDTPKAIVEDVSEDD